MTGTQIAEKRRGFYIIPEPCGAKAKYKLTYTLNGKLTEKTVCGKHLNSNIGWLTKIKVPYTIS